MKLVDRDYKVLREVGRWRFLLGRHICVLANFSSLRVCDRRLKILVESGYLDRKKIIYGVPYLYFLTHRARLLIGQNKRAENIRLEKINHDIAVIDCVIFFQKKYNVSMNDIISEKELHSKDGFGVSRHYPDFIINQDGKSCAFEIELTVKSKQRLEKNITSNFMDYDKQVWIVPKKEKRIIETITENINKYEGISIYYFEDVLYKEGG